MPDRKPDQSEVEQLRRENAALKAELERLRKNNASDIDPTAGADPSFRWDGDG